MQILKKLNFQCIQEPQSSSPSQASAVSHKTTGLQLDLGMYARPAGGTPDRRTYNLFVTLMNTGSLRADDYWVEVVFPTAFLDTSGNNWLEVREARTDTEWLFRAPHETNKPKLIYPNSKLDPVMSIEFIVDPKMLAE
ncbi:MAG: hypothetical protein AB1631_32725, partial [Acidobacteriota bacterium]